MNKIYNFLLDITNQKKKKGRIVTWIVLIGAILTLGLTSYYVAEKSAIIQNNNNDQLIDSYMFETPETFKEALFPAAHSFLLKWPIFVLSSMMGNTASTYITLTIVIYSITVFSFLFVMYLLSKRGMLTTALSALLLSSILLFVPPQPFDSALLPVNMAMITTRNLEFIVLFAYIYMIIKLKKVHSFRFYASVGLLGLLGATDKFFLMIVLVAAALQLAYLSLFAKEKITASRLLPLASAVGGYVLATIILVGINRSGLTGIPNPTNAAPFALISSAWQMFEAIAGTIQGIIVNFGANFFGKSATASLLPYAINGLILIAALTSVCMLFKDKKYIKKLKSSTEWNFTLWLVLTFAGAVVIFIASDHGYTYDGRYLTGALFAGLASVALLLGTIETDRMRVVLLAVIAALILLTPLNLLIARGNLSRTIDANQREIGVRTDQAATIIAKENANLLVGDYWFVTPTKLKVDPSVQFSPMSTEQCDTPNYFLTSKKWYRPAGEVNKTAYYILRDAGENAETFNHGCTMDHLNQKYGAPEKEYIIRGTDNKPIDIIRIYPYDVRSRF